MPSATTTWAGAAGRRRGRGASPVTLVVAFLAATLAAAVLAPVARPAPAAAAPDRQLYVVSDSVVLGAKDAIGRAFPGWAYSMDAFPGVMTDTAVDWVRKAGSRIGEVVVVATGYNYPYWDRARFRRNIDDMMAAAASVGARWVVWVLLREVTPDIVPNNAQTREQLQKYAWYFPLVNQDLREAATRHPNLVLADWATVGRRPGITYDIIHLNPTGAALMAGLIRSEVDGLGRLRAGSTLTVPVAGRGGVPADASAAVLNLTVTGGRAGGYLTAYPCGERPATASNVNFVAGQTVANLAVSKLGAGGAVCVEASADVHVIADLAGWFPAGADLTPTVPTRLLDTRSSGAALEPGVPFRLPVGGQGGVPGDASAAVLNVTVTRPAGPGYLMAYPCDPQPPTASNLNFVAGQTVPNLAIARLSAEGEVCFLANQATHLVVDLSGWFPTGSAYEPVTPVRVLDTRLSPGAPALGGTTTALPLSNVPDGASAVVVNLTSTASAAPGYLTASECSVPRPTASNLNFRPGVNVPNLAVVAVGDAVGGTATPGACVFASATTHVVADVNGWFTGGFEPIVPLRLVDTRDDGPNQ